MTRKKRPKNITSLKIKRRLAYYKPSTIRAEAEQDLQNYKQHGELRHRSQDVVQKTIRAALAIVIVALILAISSLIITVLR
jgi:hypothetical protein